MKKKSILPNMALLIKVNNKTMYLVLTPIYIKSTLPMVKLLFLFPSKTKLQQQQKYTILYNILINIIFNVYYFYAKNIALTLVILVFLY